METKLTLKLDRNVIQSVKRYAGENRRSVSKLAGDAFRRLAGERIPKRRESPLVEDLSGVVSETGASTEDYVAHLERKYE